MKTSLARRNRVREVWLGIPETWRTEAMSAFHTFVPVFVLSLITSIEVTDDAAWTWSVAAAILSAAARAGFKVLSMYFLTRLLPDPKN